MPGERVRGKPLGVVVVVEHLDRDAAVFLLQRLELPAGISGAVILDEACEVGRALEIADQLVEGVAGLWRAHLPFGVGIALHQVVGGEHDAGFAMPVVIFERAVGEPFRDTLEGFSSLNGLVLRIFLFPALERRHLPAHARVATN
ncbi:hypothetical protein E3H11_09525 [Bradyrhizobium brasilense]|uniref:hypothetical protein n=1 Tax=Bradyrhizobium brasilense TaxID=1419277 RepID=UPI0014578FE0|nr:hypothetical protein [Bradyrhizobium brasilense]NLS69154.1 hypothetical protein [Bradyrhizobium brasilense]